MNPDKKSIGEMPVDTYHAARQVYNLKHIYLLIGDQLDDILAKIELPMLDPRAYQDRATIARLAMVTAFQHAELLPDVVASDATRKRMDWKYALRLPVHHQGIGEPALCSFRQGLYESSLAMREYESILRNLKQVGLYGVSEKNPLTAEEVLQNVCQITRLYRLYTGMKFALGTLVAIAPDWVRAYMPPHWYERYSTGRLVQLPNLSGQEMQEAAVRLGTDIQQLLVSLREHQLEELLNQEAIQRVARLWEDQFIVNDGQLTWRLPGCAQCTHKSLGDFKQ